MTPMPSSSSGVDPQRMPPRRDEARQEQAAQAHAAHEGPQQARPARRRSSRSPAAAAGARRSRRSAPRSRCRRTAAAARASSASWRSGRSEESGRVGPSRNLPLQSGLACQSSSVVLDAYSRTRALEIMPSERNYEKWNRLWTGDSSQALIMLGGDGKPGDRTPRLTSPVGSRS